MGIKTKIFPIFSFIYKADFKNNLIEHELDHVFIGFSDKKPKPNFNEVCSWNYVDETHHRSINIWCPLVDTDSLNGRLMVCPATQSLSNDLRGTPFIPRNKQEENLFKNKAVGLNMKKGDAAIYDSALLHFSEPNITSLSRLAIAMVLIPKGAQPIHCFTSNGKTFVYNVDHEFFLTHQLGKVPSGYMVSREIPYHPTTEVSDAGSSSEKPSF